MKLKHASSEYDLHSHEISYGSGSGQQSVTGYKDTSDAASLWAVKGAQVGLHVVTTFTAWHHAHWLMEHAGRASGADGRYKPFPYH